MAILNDRSPRQFHNNRAVFIDRASTHSSRTPSPQRHPESPTQVPFTSPTARPTMSATSNQHAQGQDRDQQFSSPPSGDFLPNLAQPVNSRLPYNPQSFESRPNVSHTSPAVNKRIQFEREQETAAHTHLRNIGPDWRCNVGLRCELWAHERDSRGETTEWFTPARRSSSPNPIPDEHRQDFDWELQYTPEYLVYRQDGRARDVRMEREDSLRREEARERSRQIQRDMSDFPPWPSHITAWSPRSRAAAVASSETADGQDRGWTVEHIECVERAAVASPETADGQDRGWTVQHIERVTSSIANGSETPARRRSSSEQAHWSSSSPRSHASSRSAPNS